MNTFRLFQAMLLASLLMGATVNAEGAELQPSPQDSVAQEEGLTTLEACQKAAEANYPLIKKYDLLKSTADISIDNINKGWLPQVSATVQATAQNKVVSLPSTLTSIISQYGGSVKGIQKEQYKAEVDVNQLIYDGGRLKSQKAITKQQAEVDKAQNSVNMYNIHKSVNSLYFGILLLQDKLQLNHDLQVMLGSNQKQLEAMVKAGTASTSDLLKVKAELLSTKQDETELRSQRKSLAQTLSLYTGKAIGQLQRPKALASENLNNRPELNLADMRLKLVDEQEKALDADLKPKLSGFAQAYYGYPGYNMFDDMFSHKPSVNALIGVKLTWNIGALYTRKNDKAKLKKQRDMIENDREVFLFNNRIEKAQDEENISRYDKLRKQDDEIIALRTSIRKAAESKLRHGIIDVNDLVKEITNENSARLQSSIHEIEMLQEMYNRSYTMNY